MPRRYHRPPAVKRRKSRRTGPSLPYEEPTPTKDGGQPEDELPDEFVDEEWEEGEEFEEAPAAVATATEVRQPAGREGTRHIQRDYSYVRTELMRVLGVAVVLFAVLIAIAILR